MQFGQTLIRGTLVRRYQRFLADVETAGEIVTAHCPNPGAMVGLNSPGANVWLSLSKNSKRRLAYTLEIVETDGAAFPRTLVGINTMRPNALVEEAIRDGVIAELGGYTTIRREVRYGTNSRIDLLLEGENRPSAYVEVKNVHLSRVRRLAEFPDCVTARGAKHLRELSIMAQSGARAVMVFCVQRSDCDTFSLARDIDRAYSDAFEAATAQGVETFIYRCHICPDQITVTDRLTFANT